MSAPFLATELDGELVLLDVSRACLIQVDAWTRQVLEACDSRTTAEVAAALQVPVRRVTDALNELAAPGLVSRDQDRWRRASLRRV